MMRECSDEVRLGMMRFWSLWSRVTGRASRSLVRGLVKEVWVVREGAMVMMAWCGTREGYSVVGSDMIAKQRQLLSWQARQTEDKQATLGRL